MKKNLILLLILICLTNANAIRINEVELNPKGIDTKNEWIELFSDSEINMENWKISNSDGESIELNQTFSDYLTITIEKQWLDNKDEIVYLYENETLIDKTRIFSDSENDEKTWQFCDGWEFKSASQGQKNNCEMKIEEENNDNNSEKKTINEIDESHEINLDKEKEEEINEEAKEEEEIPQSSSTPVQINNTSSNEYNNNTIFKNTNVINLNPKFNKVIYESKNEKMKKYGIYAFMLFLIFILIIFIIKIK
ncbi:MAG: hypothetical protein ACOYT4_05305 [Nanoarchaeota archaeon]